MAVDLALHLCDRNTLGQGLGEWKTPAIRLQSFTDADALVLTVRLESAVRDLAADV